MVVSVFFSMGKQPMGMALSMIVFKQIIFNVAFELLVLYGNRHRRFEYYVPFVVSQLLELVFVLGAAVYMIVNLMININKMTWEHSLSMLVGKVFKI